MLIFKFNVDGPSRVGKSCILDKFWNETFDPEYKPTIGISLSFIKEYYLFDCKITARFWDFGDLKKFPFLLEGENSLYKASGVILVVDISSPDTFNEIDFYLKRAKHANIEPHQIILVGNKTDLCKNDELKENSSHLSEITEKYNLAKFFTTSAKNNENLENLFEFASLLFLYNEKIIDDSEFTSYKEKME